MKLAGIAGKGRGKLGNMVFRSTAGAQVVSQYQPSVSNPNTAAQTAQRAKFKLMSQVAAAVQSAIAIPKSGNLSPRNQFVSKNIGSVTVTDGVAVLDYAGLQFTAGSVALPAIGAARADGSITVSLTSSATVNRVVYLIFSKTIEGSLRYVVSSIVSVAGANGDFPTSFTDPGGDVVVYAYGLRDLNKKASANYDNYTVATGTALASLLTNRTLKSSDYQVTATSGVTLFGSSSDTTTPSIVSLSATYALQYQDDVVTKINTPGGTNNFTHYNEAHGDVQMALTTQGIADSDDCTIGFSTDGTARFSVDDVSLVNGIIRFELSDNYTAWLPYGAFTITLTLGDGETRYTASFTASN